MEIDVEGVGALAMTCQPPTHDAVDVDAVGVESLMNVVVSFVVHWKT